MKKFLYFISACLVAITPLKGATIPFLPGEGVCHFLKSEYRCSYWILSRFFDTQINNAFCSVASSVMVLNALEVDGTNRTKFGDYSLFTQETFFTDAVNEIVHENLVRRRGMTLDEIARALRTYDVSATPYFAEVTRIETFRESLKNTLTTQDQFIIANFHRPTIGQSGGGHFSPIAAYNEENDTVLILDVSRYKNPPFWVSVEDLWLSMLQLDSDSGLSRGYIAISPLT